MLWAVGLRSGENLVFRLGSLVLGFRLFGLVSIVGFTAIILDLGDVVGFMAVFWFCLLRVAVVRLGVVLVLYWWIRLWLC